MFGDVRNYGWLRLVKFESKKCEFEIAYLIVPLFDMKSKFMVVIDLTKSIYDVLVVKLKWA